MREGGEGGLGGVRLVTLSLWASHSLGKGEGREERRGVRG